MAQKTKTLIQLFIAFFPLALWAQAQIGPVSFTLPSGFACRTEGSQMICTNPDEPTPKTAVIVATLKLRNPQDSIENFKSEISRPRTLESVEGPTTSTVVKVGMVKINDWEWVESVHKNSEVMDYMTHYYATVTDDYAALMTFSIKNNEYRKFLPQFTATVNTLVIESAFQGSGDEAEAQSDVTAENQNLSRSRNIIILAICGALAVGLLLYLGLKK